MKYLVYLTVCKPNGKIYIGVHQTKDPDIFDNYLANGVYTNRPASYKKATTPFKKAVQKYGINAFRRTTLAVFDNKDDAYKLEALLVNEEFIKREDNYNIKLGGSGGCPESNKRKVYMYNSQGEFVMEFKSVYDCMQYLYPDRPNGSHICRAIQKGWRVKNYQFSYEKVEKMKVWKYEQKHLEHLSDALKNIDRRRVGRFDDNDKLLEIYKSPQDAVDHGYKNVRFVLQGKRAHCLGFKFKYLD